VHPSTGKAVTAAMVLASVDEQGTVDPALLKKNTVV
jgi:hypothetical protein